MTDNLYPAIRFAENSDIDSLKRLWKSCFGDDDYYIDFFFENRFEPNECLTAFCGRELAGMLFLLPITAVCGEKKYSARYIYAVCTEPQFRSRSVSTRLLEYAHEYMKKSGVAMSLLVPAEPSLFEYYKKRGFETEFFCREIKIKAEKGDFPFKEANLPELFERRNALFSDSSLYMMWDRKALGFQQRECELSGGKTLLLENGYAVCFPFEDKVLVKEYGFPALDRAILAAAAYYFGKETAVVRLSAAEGESGSRPFAMTKWYDSERRVNGGAYPRFTLVFD